MVLLNTALEIIRHQYAFWFLMPHGNAIRPHPSGNILFDESLQELPNTTMAQPM